MLYNILPENSLSTTILLLTRFSVKRMLTDMNYLTPEEVALKLGVTPQRVRAMIQSGRLRAVKKSRFYLIPVSALKSVLNRKPGRPRKVGA